MPKFPVFLMVGSDPNRRKLLQERDPEGKYTAKAQLPFLGRRVADFVMEELVKSKYISTIYILGQTKETLPFNYDFPIEYVNIDPSAEFPDKLMAGLNYLEENGNHADQIIVCTSDAPGIRVEHIDEFLEFLQSREGYDFVPSLVPQKLELEEFGESNRVVGKFTDVEIFPGELYALSKRGIREGVEIIRKINNARRKRSFWTVAFLLARKPKTWPKLVKIALKKGELKDAVIFFERALNCKVDYKIINDIGFGMDMDLPGDYEKLEQYVKKIKPEAVQN
ncbi:MAG: hypothetical protein ACTSQE_12705 [Candidatus Heimdallarchaeaceae archaeon]